MFLQFSLLLLLSHRTFLTVSSPIEPRQTDRIVKAIPLHRSKNDLQNSSRALRKRGSRLVNANRTSRVRSGSSLLHATGASFLAEITFGSQTFLSVVDTGSSDTWIVKNDFQCIDLVTRQSIPQKQCSFGGTYTPGNEFTQIETENFNVTYGDEEFLTGVVGTLPVTIAGIRVPDQQISLPDVAAWQGDGITSGIIGLAYPALTANYAGIDPHVDEFCGPSLPTSQCNQITYSSLIHSMFFTQNLTAPVFALALSRDESDSGDGGYLTIGGIPDPKLVGVTNNVVAKTPIRVLPRDNKFRYYLINIDGLVILPVGTSIPDNSSASSNSARVDIASNVTARVNASTKFRADAADAPSPEGATSGSGSQEYVVDSGTTLNFFASTVTTMFVSMFNPPATYDSYTGFYFVQCDAEVPPLGVQINGKVFWHNPKDLVRQYDSLGQTCISGVQDSSLIGNFNILGDVFLNNVLAIFDLRRNEIRFAARRNYSS